MMRQTVEFYRSPDGKEPFIDWFDSTHDIRTQNKIERRLEQVRRGNFGFIRKLRGSDDIFELKFRSGHRIYYSIIDNGTVLILYGGDKSSQEADIKLARGYLSEYRRKQNE